MPIPRLQLESTAILVIDVQEKLLPTIIDRGRIVANCSILLKLAQVLDVPAFVTEQYVRGLGRTVELVASSMADPSWRIEKTQFSGLVDVVDERLTQWSRPNVLIAGVEADVCVLQTVLDLQASGRQAFVCVDAVAVGRGDLHAAFARMRDAGAILTGVLSATYEMMGDSRHPAFKRCLELVKQLEK